jgi:hypothetical protein
MAQRQGVQSCLLQVQAEKALVVVGHRRHLKMAVPGRRRCHHHLMVVELAFVSQAVAAEASVVEGQRIQHILLPLPCLLGRRWLGRRCSGHGCLSAVYTL